MTRIESVSIGHYAFTLEKEAYDLVNEYLNTLTNYYKNQPSGDEIIEGIEERMAELLFEKISPKAVVTKKCVQEVIDVIGTPYTIDGDTSTPNEPTPTPTQKRKKKLYRDGSNRVFGGVLGGLAVYLNISPLILRLIYLLVFFGGVFFHDDFPFDLDVDFGGILFIIYIILWIAMPKANTVAKRYEMRGLSLNADDIAKSIENGEDIYIDNRGKGLGRVMYSIVSIFLFLMGLIGFLVGLFAVLCLTKIEPLAYTNFAISHESIRSIVDWMQNITPLLVVCSSAAYFLPCIWMIYAGFVGLFHLDTPKWKPGLILIILWIISIFVWFVIAVPEILNSSITI